MTARLEGVGSLTWRERMVEQARARVIEETTTWCGCAVDRFVPGRCYKGLVTCARCSNPREGVKPGDLRTFNRRRNRAKPA